MTILLNARLKLVGIKVTLENDIFATLPEQRHYCACVKVDCNDLPCQPIVLAGKRRAPACAASNGMQRKANRTKWVQMVFFARKTIYLKR